MPAADIFRDLDQHRGYLMRVARRHLSVCAACTRFERQIRFLRAAMRKSRE